MGNPLTTADPIERRGIDPMWARVRPLVFRTIIGAVIAAGLVGIVAVLLGDFGRVAVQLLLTIVVVVVFALLSWYDADVSSRRSGTFAFASILTSMYLLVAGLCKVWIVPRSVYPGDDVWVVGEQFWQWIGILVVARVALLHVHLLLVIHRRYPTPVLQVVAKSTVGVIAVLALLLSLPLLFPDVDFARGFWRTVWVVVILDVLGTVVVPLSNALFRPRGAAGPVGPVGSVGSWSGDTLASPWGDDATAPSGPPVGVPVSAAVAPSAPSSNGWADPTVPPPAWAATPVIGSDGGRTTTQSVTTEDVAPTSESRVSSGSPVPDTVTGTDGLLYEQRPESLRALAWPRYADGTALPALPDGAPDFSSVRRA